MKKVWNIIGFLAVVNLLAVGGFVGWLGATDRLNAERLRSLRDMLKPTISEQAGEEARVSAAAEVKSKEAAEAAKRAGAPVSSGQKIEDHRQAQDLLDQQLVRMKEEARQLKELIQTRRDELDRQTAALDAARADFDRKQAEWKQLSEDEQFQQAVGALEAQKPADAAKLLNAILTVPPSAQAVDATLQTRKQREIVIRYLAAMADRSRAKILAEFIKSDDKLAAELLEDLRKRGENTTAASAVGP